MTSDRSILEHQIERVELEPFTLERFHQRRSRKERNRRIRAGVVALAVVAAGIGGVARTFSSGPVPAGDPRNPFLGTWVGADTDGSTQTMVIRASEGVALEVVVRDDLASVCSGTPSTMTGTARLLGSGQFVIPSPALTCDGGSEPAALAGPPLEEQLQNLTFVHDPRSDVLTDDFGVVWERVPGEDPSPEPAMTPAPTGPTLRGAGEVLWFTGNQAPGDLVAVTPETGEERVLAEDLVDPVNARWSADGRWVAFEMGGALWVVDRTSEPRRIFQGAQLWAWSSAGARLAVIRDRLLSVVDPSTGEATELAPIVGDVTSSLAWSPDGTRIVFGARGGLVTAVDTRTGERSQLVQLPGEDLDSIDGLEWSPDGARIAVYNDLQPGAGRLFVLRPDGSDIRVLAEDQGVFGFEWSPDGSRIAFSEDHEAELRVFVAPADGSTRSLVASLPNGDGNPVWSPDGSRIGLGGQNAFLSEDHANLVIDADGAGDALPLDDLTYESWRGGEYDCDCDLFG